MAKESPAVSRLDKPPVRKFVGRSFGPEFETLGKIRDVIDEVDDQIIQLFAIRSIAVLAATCHKESLIDVAQEERQAAVLEGIYQRAVDQHSPLTGFPELMTKVYRVAVPGFVTLQQAEFINTIPVDSPLVEPL